MRRNTRRYQKMQNQLHNIDTDETASHVVLVLF